MQAFYNSLKVDKELYIVHGMFHQYEIELTKKSLEKFTKNKVRRSNHRFNNNMVQGLNATHDEVLDTSLMLKAKHLKVKDLKQDTRSMFSIIQHTIIP